MGFGFGLALNLPILLLLTGALCAAAFFFVGECKEGAWLVCLAYGGLLGTMLVTMWITAIAVRRDKIIAWLKPLAHYFFRERK